MWRITYCVAFSSWEWNCIPPPLAIKLQYRREAKIANLDIHVLVNEEIPELEVAVDHILLVQILHGQQSRGAQGE
jgi:hypothetical protein